MTAYSIRLMTADDAAEGAKLWHKVFGDAEALVLEFFRLFGHDHGFGACAEFDGEIVAAAYCPMGTDYIAPDGTEKKGAYLYAVATHHDHRKHGLAREICLLLRDTAFQAGADYVFTRPSEESLYPWYESKIGAVPVLGGTPAEFTRTADSPFPVRSLSAEEYGLLRNRKLTGTAHVRHSHRWLEWESLLHKAYGGGFYAAGDHIASCYRDETTLQVSELLPAPTHEAVQSLLGHTGAAKALCMLPGNGPYVSAAAKNGTLPHDNPWFGPCYG